MNQLKIYFWSYKPTTRHINVSLFNATHILITKALLGSSHVAEARSQMH
jgi:hypothetical protein